MNDASIWIAASSLFGTGVLAIVTLITKRDETVVDAQTSLTAGQLAFVNTLSAREERLQGRIDQQQVEIDRLRRQVVVLQETCRAAGIPIPAMWWPAVEGEA